MIEQQRWQRKGHGFESQEMFALKVALQVALDKIIYAKIDTCQYV